MAASAASGGASAVERAAAPKGGDGAGHIVAAETPATGGASVTASVVERAPGPKGADGDGRIVAAEAPRIDERPAPAPDDEESPAGSRPRAGRGSPQGPA